MDTMNMKSLKNGTEKRSGMDRRSGRERRSGMERRKFHDPQYSHYEKHRDHNRHIGLEIPEDVLQRTTRCDKHFSCLSGDAKEMCKVIEIFGEKACFVRSKSRKPCPYQRALVGSFMCTCPTRLAIYNKYGV